VVTGGTFAQQKGRKLSLPTSSRLSDAQEQQLQDYLDQQAQDPQAGVRRAEDLRAWIQQQFGQLYSLPGLYDLLHRLGYS
jgi:transposase